MNLFLCSIKGFPHHHIPIPEVAKYWPSLKLFDEFPKVLQKVKELLTRELPRFLQRRIPQETFQLRACVCNSAIPIVPKKLVNHVQTSCPKAPPQGNSEFVKMNSSKTEEKSKSQKEDHKRGTCERKGTRRILPKPMTPKMNIKMKEGNPNPQ